MEEQQKKGSYECFYEEAPAVAQAFGGLVQALGESGLDDKTQQLIYIGMRAALGDSQAVLAHVPMAKQAGASREEIKGTLLTTLSVCGVTSVLACLQPALAIYDQR